MSNRDRAAEVIRTWQARHKTEMDNNPDWAAQNLAGDLAQAGLLAAELPEPDHDARDPEWRSEYEEDYGYSAPDVWDVGTRIGVGVFRGSHEITVWDDREPLEPFSIAEARQLAYALLAAANRSEETLLRQNSTADIANH